DVMVDNTLHHIEKSPAQQQAAPENSIRQYRFAFIGHPPEQVNAQRRREPGKSMEDSVPEHNGLFIQQCVRWQFGRDHLMPLQNLVQYNAVHKATHTYTYKCGRRYQWTGSCRLHFFDGYLSFHSVLFEFVQTVYCHANDQERQ